MNFNLSGHVVLLKLFTHSQSNTEMNSIQIEVALKKYTTVYEFISLGLNSESFLIVWCLFSRVFDFSMYECFLAQYTRYILSVCDIWVVRCSL